MAISNINMEKCVRCGQCENFCPVDVIRFDKEKKEPVVAYLKDCMLCGLCEDRCPVKAISVDPFKQVNPMVAWR